MKNDSNAVAGNRTCQGQEKEGSTEAVERRRAHSYISMEFVEKKDPNSKTHMGPEKIKNGEKGR